MGRGRNAQVERVLGILSDLFTYGDLDVYRLAEQYGTSEKTIRRDLEALSAHFPLEAESGDKGLKRWRIRPGDRREKLARLLDASDALALRLAIASSGAGPGKERLLTLTDRIDEVLGPKARENLQRIEQAFHFDDRQAFRGAPPDVLWPLVNAIADRRVCLVIYGAAGGAPKKYRVLPLKLFVHDGSVMLFAVALRWESVIQLNLNRLKHLKVLEERAEPPTDFDAEKQLRSAFRLYAAGRPVKHVLRFEADVAGLIRERQWHPDQALTDLPDGRVELSFPSPQGSYEVEAWVASWRTNVEVVKPESLRKQMGKLGRWLTLRYCS